MLRGTRIIEGDEAVLFSSVIGDLSQFIINKDFEEVIVPVLWEQQTFIDKAGPEIISQMWSFNDKADRPVCLIPEVTGLIQEQWRETWSKTKKKPHKIFYVSRCYRYEKPQAGRYREFTQFGIEILGPNPKDYAEEAMQLLGDALNFVNLQRWTENTGNLFKYDMISSVKRGLAYYIEDGFEATVPALGAQKQIAGGGTYAEGCGWAIGVDRLVLALGGK